MFLGFLDDSHLLGVIGIPNGPIFIKLSTYYDKTGDVDVFFVFCHTFSLI